MNMCCVLPSISEPPKIVDVYKETLILMNDLELGLSESETTEMRNSRNLTSDFIPMKFSRAWYNVRIQCDRYSIIMKSHR